MLFYLANQIDVSEAGLNYFPRFVIDWRLVRKGAVKEGDAETGGSSEDILLLLNLDGNNLRALPEADWGQYTASARPAGQTQKSDASGSPCLMSSVKPSNSNKVAHKEGRFSHREGFGFVLQVDFCVASVACSFFDGLTDYCGRHEGPGDCQASQRGREQARLRSSLPFLLDGPSGFSCLTPSHLAPQALQHLNLANNLLETWQQTEMESLLPYLRSFNHS